MYDKIKHWYDTGLWSADKVLDAVAKAVLTQQQAESIIGSTPKAVAGK